MNTSSLMNDKWKIEDFSDQSGKIFLITGANSGLGLKASEVLASKGAEVIMISRSKEKGEHAKKSILQEYPKANVH